MTRARAGAPAHIFQRVHGHVTRKNDQVVEKTTLTLLWTGVHVRVTILDHLQFQVGTFKHMNCLRIDYRVGKKPGVDMVIYFDQLSNLVPNDSRKIVGTFTLYELRKGSTATLFAELVPDKVETEPVQQFICSRNKKQPEHPDTVFRMDVPGTAHNMVEIRKL